MNNEIIIILALVPALYYLNPWIENSLVSKFRKNHKWMEPQP